MKVAPLAATAVLTVASSMSAQGTNSPPTGAPRTIRTYHLTYATSQGEQNEILTAVRNIAAPTLRIFLLQTSNEIAAYGTAEDLAQLTDLLQKLDIPHKQYRVTYTLTETDNGKRIGLQHYAMVVTPGQRTQLKEGSRVPVITGSFSPSDSKGTVKQATYLDVGLNFDATLETHGTGFQLRSKVEQSSIAEEKSGPGADDPVIRQTLLEGTSILPEGKTVSLGSLDVLGSTRHLDVDAMVEAVR